MTCLMVLEKLGLFPSMHQLQVILLGGYHRDVSLRSHAISLAGKKKVFIGLSSIGQWFSSFLKILDTFGSVFRNFSLVHVRCVFFEKPSDF